MAESPLATLARLLAGVVLVQGRLGHQVLGQLLIAGTNDAAIAGAAVVVAGTMHTRNAAAQVALRTAAPAIAVHALLHGEERRVNRLEQLVRDRENKITARDARLEAQNRDLAAKATTLERDNATLGGEKTKLRDERTALERAKAALESEKAALEGTQAALASERTTFEGEKANLHKQVRELEEENSRLVDKLATVPAALAKAALRAKKRRATPEKPASAKRAKRPRKKPGR